MEDQQIKEFLGQALITLQERDNWLFTHELSEQSISHKLAEYLQTLFGAHGYDVDCEYNGDVDDGQGRKRIQILQNTLEQYGLLRPKETELEMEVIQRAVFPDIIVHKRGSNADNLLIIEVKKESSRVPFEYDRLKLIAYTSDQYGNHLDYQCGAFIITNREGGYSVEYYKAGQVE